MQPHQEQINYQQLTTFDNLDLLRATYTRQTVARHFHDGFCFGVIEQGVHVFECHGQTWVATAGQIIMSNPGAMHTGRGSERLELSDAVSHGSAASTNRIIP